MSNEFCLLTDKRYIYLGKITLFTNPYNFQTFHFCANYNQLKLSLNRLWQYKTKYELNKSFHEIKSRTLHKVYKLVNNFLLGIIFLVLTMDQVLGRFGWTTCIAMVMKMT